LKRDIPIRAGVVIQLTLIAVASLSLQAVFGLKVIEMNMERSHVEAAVSVAEVVRNAVESRGRIGGDNAPSVLGGLANLSPYVREVALVPEGPPADRVLVTPVGKKVGGILSVHPLVDVTLPTSGTPGGAKGIRVRFFSPGIEEEARRLIGVATMLVVADVVLIVLFGYFLMDRSVVRPVRRLAAVSEKIAAGDYLLRADESPGNEVGQLGASFNRMIGGILSAQARVRQAERDTFRSENLATVGRLAAGVAHEVGNPLMAIRGYAQYLRKSPRGAGETEECLDKIVAETGKIENIVRGLLTVAAPGRGEDEETDVNAVVRETVALLSFRKMFREIEVGVEYGEETRVRMAEGRFRQVLLNILLNAVDAMGGRGNLRIRTFRADPWVPPAMRLVRRRASDPQGDAFSPRRGERGSVPSKGVAVSVSDTGCGIRPEDLKNIFDPFFTTKEPGKGTGLGLSVSRAIVEAGGGEILAESPEGRGATFTVILPFTGEKRTTDADGGRADG
jgi:signal transduction histidine kinase